MVKITEREIRFFLMMYKRSPKIVVSTPQQTVSGKWEIIDFTRKTPRTTIRNTKKAVKAVVKTLGIRTKQPFFRIDTKTRTLIKPTGYKLKAVKMSSRILKRSGVSKNKTAARMMVARIRKKGFKAFIVQERGKLRVVTIR